MLTGWSPENCDAGGERGDCNCGWAKPHGPTCPDCGGRTPDHPAEDAREARLSEGDVERLADALNDHAYTYPDSFCACGAYVTYETWQRHFADALAPVVADMLTQREREVVARIEALRATWMRDETRSAEYQDGRADCAEDLRRALGGTADGQGT